MLKILKNRNNSKRKSNMNDIDNKPYSVIRENVTIIQSFEDLYNASVFSTKLNINYFKNGIKTKSMVIKLVV
ncbi:MAG: hypothetical protein JEY96_03070 [Bacteroidales bacterium]|nr:hypothetical protein [Bacteroidales bacterium]